MHDILLVWDWEGSDSSEQHKEARKGTGATDFLETRLPSNAAADLVTIFEDLRGRMLRVEMMRCEVQGYVLYMIPTAELI